MQRRPFASGRSATPRLAIITERQHTQIRQPSARGQHMQNGRAPPPTAQQSRGNANHLRRVPPTPHLLSLPHMQPLLAAVDDIPVLPNVDKWPPSSVPASAQNTTRQSAARNPDVNALLHQSRAVAHNMAADAILDFSSPVPRQVSRTPWVATLPRHLQPMLMPTAHQLSWSVVDTSKLTNMHTVRPAPSQQPLPMPRHFEDVTSPLGPTVVGLQARFA